jgi:dynein heavy chain
MTLAMGPPGGGRNLVTPRLLRHFNQITLHSFSDQTLDRIFRTILDWHFQKGFSKDIINISKKLIEATKVVYKESVNTLLPTPSKSHYTFNLRDFSRVIQGILLSTPEKFQEKSKIIRLWIHEMMRVFYDRLIENSDRSWFFESIKKTTNTVLETNFDKILECVDIQKKGTVEENDVRNLLFGTFKEKYYEEYQISEIEPVINKCLQDFNNTSKKPMDLVMFKFAIEHLSRISRVFQQQRGNILCVGFGGSGRQSLTKLAAFIASVDVFQVEISKGYNTMNWHDDMKKVFKKAGIEDKPTVFLFSDTQIQQESFLEDISNILNLGEIPNLYSAADEREEIYEAFRKKAKSSDQSPAALFAQFVDKCRENIHIVLCMSPVGEAFRTRLRKFPSLINCCTINWFFPWPQGIDFNFNQDALEMVASSFLAEVEINQNIRGNVIEMCNIFHQSAIKYSDSFYKALRRKNYVTPTSYLELIKTFKSLLDVQRGNILQMKNRYVVGLEKLGFAQASVSKMQQDLGELQPQLIKTKEETNTIMLQIETESKDVQETRTIVKQEEEIASRKAEEAKIIKEDCEKDLAEAIPALMSAISALDTLKQSEISVLKVMKSPPAGVKLVMEAICIMKDVKPVKIPDPNGSGKKIEDYWGPSKALLSDMKFLESLKIYDKDNISPAIMKLIRGKYTENPEFDPEKIKTASSAAEGLCRWVRAMEIYDRVAKQVAPKKESLLKAETELAQTMAGLVEKQNLLKSVEERIFKLEAKFKDMTEKKIALENQVQNVSKQLERAEKLIGSLGDEKERWTECASNLEIKLRTVLGDVLISSGIVAYLGAFTKAFRDDCVSEWVSDCKKFNIPCSEQVRLSNVLGDVNIFSNSARQNQRMEFVLTS